MSNQNNAQTKHDEHNDKRADAAKASINKAADQGAQVADAAREGLNKMADLREKATESTKQVLQNSIQTATDQARAVTERFTRSLGYTGQDAERFAEQSKRNVEAVTRCGTILTQSFRDASRSWFELGQKQVARNLEGAKKLASAKSVQEFSAIQSELVRESLEQVVQSSRTIAEKSLHAADEAGKVFSSVAKSASQAR
jgi:hypothetical protein